VTTDHHYQGTFDLDIAQSYDNSTLAGLGVFPAITVDPAGCFGANFDLLQSDKTSDLSSE
jgi:hypothetical protein